MATKKASKSKAGSAGAASPPPAYVGPSFTRTQRAALSGSRTPHPLDPPAPPLTREAGWEILLRISRELDETSGPVEPQDDLARKLYAPIQASIDSGKAPDTLDIDTEQIRSSAMARAIHEGDGKPDEATQALVAFWAGTMGPGWIFEASRSPRKYAIGASQTTSAATGKAILRRILTGQDLSQFSPFPWNVLTSTTLRNDFRRLLFALPEDQWLKAKQAILAWQEARAPHADTSVAGREDAWIAFLLARDAELSNEFARSRLETNTWVENRGCLLAAITDLDLATNFVTAYAPVLDIDGAYYALDLVETFGGKAAPMLQAILDRAANRKPRLKPFYRGRFEAGIKLALTDPRP